MPWGDGRIALQASLPTGIIIIVVVVIVIIVVIIIMLAAASDHSNMSLVQAYQGSAQGQYSTGFKSIEVSRMAHSVATGSAGHFLLV